MIDKASAAGWVVQVSKAATESEPAKAAYFNVAIKSDKEAIAAAVRKSGIVGASGYTLRTLCPEEIAFLGMKVGEAKPA